MLLVDGMPATALPGSVPIECYVGFRGIEASLFTGAETSAHGVWTDYRRGPASPYAWVQRVPCVRHLSRIAPRGVNRLVGAAVHQLTRSLTGRVALPKSSLIPLDILAQMEFASPYLPWEAGAYGGTATLFDRLRRHGRSFACVAPPSVSWWRTTDEKVIAALRRSLRQGVKDFYYVKLVDLDCVSHHHGPESPPALEVLGRTLERVDEVVRLLRERVADLRWIVLSDHGFLTAEHRIGAAATLEELRRRWGDFVYFLDSTMVRCWFDDDEARQRVTEYLATVEGLTSFGDEEKRRHGLEGLPRAYGDAIYVAGHGYVVWPDFFWMTPPSGMHGYLPHRMLEAGIAGEGWPVNERERYRFTDIMGLVLDMMEIQRE